MLYFYALHNTFANLACWLLCKMEKVKLLMCLIFNPFNLEDNELAPVQPNLECNSNYKKENGKIIFKTGFIISTSIPYMWQGEISLHHAIPPNTLEIRY